MKQLTYDEMVAAMRSNDAQCDGRFYVGVHSTRIYCLPSCKARLPKLSNVRFYATREDALAAGLRGCKRCRSDRFPDVLPDWIKRLVSFMREHQNERLSEACLVTSAGVDITTIRRHFTKKLGMTPLAFNRRQRLLHARRLLESGTDYLTCVYECGYESASGFRDAFVRQFGVTPGRLHAQK